MYNKDEILIDMLFDRRPIEDFEKLWNSKEDLDWSGLLNMCYCEESYESVGADEGYLDKFPINHERLEFLRKLINFLEDKGIKFEN